MKPILTSLEVQVSQHCHMTCLYNFLLRTKDFSRIETFFQRNWPSEPIRSFRFAFVLFQSECYPDFLSVAKECGYSSQNNEVYCNTMRLVLPPQTERLAWISLLVKSSLTFGCRFMCENYFLSVRFLSCSVCSWEQNVLLQLQNFIDAWSILVTDLESNHFSQRANQNAVQWNGEPKHQYWTFHHVPHWKWVRLVF